MCPSRKRRIRPTFGSSPKASLLGGVFGFLLLVVLSAAAAANEDVLVEQRTFWSPVLGKSAQVDVMVPAACSAASPCPVLYFLHGGFGEGPGNFVGGILLLQDLLALHGIVGVLPVSGSPWVDPKKEPAKRVQWEVRLSGVETPGPSPDVRRGQVSTGEASYSASHAYETHFLTEVLPFVESNYPVRSDRSGRGLIGHSGGAYGSFMLALRHPDLFVFVGGSSGPLSTRHPSCVAICTPVQLLLGGRDPFTDEIYWRSTDPKELADNFLGAPFTVTHSAGCPGALTPAGDPTCDLEGFARPNNDDFEARLVELGVPHSYFASEATTHNVLEVGIPIYREHFLPRAAATFANPPPDPPKWSYRTSDRAFSVWGWVFQVDRFNTEFLSLVDVDDGGFTARGTGQLSIVTPPAYDAGALHRVTHIAPDGSSFTQAVRADEQGRLAFTVRLGEPRLADQHTLLEAAGLFENEDVEVSIEPDPTAETDVGPECPPVWVYPVIRCGG